MKQINFIIAIATFNRVNNLKVVIDSILKQKLKKNVNLEVVISNSCSTDETSSFLKSLKTNKQFHIHNKSEKIPNNTLSQFVNFENLSKTIPEHADWVWWLGDDDKLVNKLWKVGIDCRKFWHPLNKQIPYKNNSKYYPNSSKYAKKALWLPSDMSLNNKDIIFISKHLKKIIS